MKLKNLFCKTNLQITTCYYIINVENNIFFSLQGTIEFQKQKAAQSVVLVRKIYLNVLIMIQRSTTVIKRPFWPALCHVFYSAKKSTAKPHKCKMQNETLDVKQKRIFHFRFFKEYNSIWPDLTLIDNLFLCFITVCVFSESTFFHFPSDRVVSFFRIKPNLISIGK